MMRRTKYIQMNKHLLVIAVFILSQFCLFAQKNMADKIVILPGHINDVNAVAFAPKNKGLVSAGWGNVINIYKSDSPFAFVEKLSGHAGAINVLKFNRLGSFLASGGNDYTVYLWDSSFIKIRKFDDLKGNHKGNVTTLAFDFKGKYLYSGSADTKINIWELASGKLAKVLSNGVPVTSIAVSPQSSQIYVAGEEPKIKILSIANGTILKTFDGHTDMVNAIVISPNNKLLLSGSSDKTAKLWDLKTTKEIRTFAVECWKVMAVAFSDDSKYCATGCNDGSVKIWDVESGKLISQVLLPGTSIIDISFNRNSEFIAVATTLRAGSNYGVRIIETGIEGTKPEPPPPPKSRDQLELDSIRMLRTLIKEDSLKFKSLLDKEALELPPPIELPKPQETPKEIKVKKNNAIDRRRERRTP